MRSNRNGNAHARFHWDDFLVIMQLSPHLSTTGEEEPDFLYASMRYRSGCHTGCKFKMCDAPTTELQQNTNIRSVRSGGVRSYGQSLGAEATHRVPPDDTVADPAPLVPWGKRATRVHEEVGKGAECLAHISYPVNREAVPRSLAPNPQPPPSRIALTLPCLKGSVSPRARPLRLRGGTRQRQVSYFSREAVG